MGQQIVSGRLIKEPIEVDTRAIPSVIRDDLAAVTLECVRDFLRQPGGREILDARIAAGKNGR